MPKLSGCANRKQGSGYGVNETKAMSDRNKIEELRKAVTRNAFLTPEDSSRVADAIIAAIDQLMSRENGQIAELIYTVGENVKNGIDKAVCSGPYFVDAVRNGVESDFSECDQ